MREICEHRPTGLVIALNGEVVAARDVSSACASLKAETRPAESLCFVEVFSEQGLLLLALPVPEQPPYSAPELTHALVMSDDRSLNLQVSFTSDGASIEAIYTDPHFASCDEEVEAQDLLEDERAPIGFERDSQENDFAGPSAKHHATHSWWRVLLERTRAIVSGRQPLVIVSVLIAVAALTWSSGYHRPERIDFVSSLHESLTAEKSEGPIARIPVSSADNANSSPESPLPH